MQFPPTLTRPQLGTHNTRKILTLVCGPPGCASGTGGVGIDTTRALDTSATVASARWICDIASWCEAGVAALAASDAGGPLVLRRVWLRGNRRTDASVLLRHRCAGDLSYRTRINRPRMVLGSATEASSAAAAGRRCKF